MNSLFNIINQPIIALDSDFKICDINDSFIQKFSLLNNKFLGRHITSIFEPDSIPIVNTNLRKATSNPDLKLSFKAKIFNKENQGLFLTWQINYSDSDNLFYLITLDNGNLINSEQTEIESDSIYESLSEGIIVYDKDARIIKYNTSVLNLLDIKKDQLLGKTPFDLWWKPRKSNGEYFSTNELPSIKTFNTLLPQHNVTMELENKSGIKRWIKLNSEPIFLNNDKTKLNGIVVTFEDATEKQITSNIINVINKDIDLLYGEDLINELAKSLSINLLGDIVFIGRPSADGNNIETIINYINKEKSENFKYSLQNTPCEKVISGMACYHNGNVQNKYPKDRMLEGMNINSYIGIPLKNKDGITIGILTMLFESKISEFETKQNIINIYASRAAVELERISYEAKLIENDKFNKTLFDTVPFPIFVKDTKCNFTNFNSTFEKYFQYSKDELIGKCVHDIFPKYLADEYYSRDLELLNSDTELQVYEWFVKLKNGEMRNVVFRKSKFKDENNHVKGIIGIASDITNEKAIKKELTKSEKFFKGIFNNTRLGIAITDKTGVITKTNPSLESFLGYTEDELIGKDFNHFTHPDDLAYEATFLSKLLGNEDLINYDKRYVKKDGSIAWGNLRLSSSKDSNGEVVNFIGTVLDINGRKQIELKLKESENKYKTLFESANDGIMILADGIFIDCNAKFLEIIGSKSKENIIGKNISELSPKFSLEGQHSDDLDYKVLFNQTQNNNTSFNWTIENDNQITYTEINLFKSKLNDSIQAFGIVRDISERVNFQKQLSKKNKDLLEFYNVLDKSLIISQFKTDGTVLSINDNYEKVSGYKFEELIGKQNKSLRITDHTEQFWKDLWNTILNGDIWQGEIKKRKKDGSIFWVASVIYPVKIDSSQEINYFLKVSRDITLLKNYQKDLEAKVERRTSKLQELNNEKDFLMQMMSHDLKNPLTAIFMQMSLLETYARRYNDSKMIEKIHKSLKVAKEMNQLIKNILELNEAESSNLPQEQKNINLNTTIRGVIKSLKPLADFKAQKIKFSPDSSLKEIIQTNESYLKQILENLVSNAIKYSSEGKQIFITLKIIANNTIIEIIDNGVGIKQSEIDKIFIKFTRVSSKPTSGESSNGIGLAIVKRLCELLNYKIQVESKVGEGTKFTLTIPH